MKRLCQRDFVLKTALIGILAVLLGCPLGAFAAGDMEDIGNFYAQAINNQGQVVGWAGARAVLWDNGTMIDLGTLGGVWSYAYDINDLGQVVGYSETSSGTYHGFLWENGTMTDLGTLGGPFSVARAINNVGQIVGDSVTPSDVNHAFLWSNGTMTDLGSLGYYSYALDINDLGQVVGSSSITGYEEHAVLWTGGVIKDLGTMGGPYSRAWAINNSGQVVGESQDSSGGQPAFLWSEGVMMDLGTPPGAEWVVAYDINNSGQVVGQFYGPFDDMSFVEHGFLWDAGFMTDLGIIGMPSLPSGIALVNINDWGQVVMRAETSYDGESSVFLFTPSEKIEFTGFFSPIEGADTTGGSIVDPIRAFKLRSTIPVKMILNREASPVTTGNHILQLFKVNDKTTLDIAVDATPADAATTGNSFRLSDASTGEWHFNLSTRTLSKGIWQIKAILSDNTSHTAFIELK